MGVIFLSELTFEGHTADQNPSFSPGKKASHPFLPVDCREGSGLWFGLQVRFLEQQNQVLETKWELLQQLDLNNCKNNLEPILEGYISNMRKQLETLSGDRVRLDSELRNVRDVVEDYKKK